MSNYDDALEDVDTANGEEIGPWSTFILARAQVHATLALVDAIREERAQAREDAGDRCRMCYYPAKHGQPDGELYCDNCGWSA